MGFESKKCHEALEEVDGNIEAAIELLFATCI
jgi:translation elongation factor EF-Ts